MTVLPRARREPVPQVARRRPRSAPTASACLPAANFGHGDLAAQGHLRPERARTSTSTSRRWSTRWTRSGPAESSRRRFASHPLLPIRLKAASCSRGRRRQACRVATAVVPHALTDDELEDAVDELVKLTRRYPFQPMHLAVMRAVALGGAMLLAADKDVSDEEVKILVQILPSLVHRRARGRDHAPTETIAGRSCPTCSRRSAEDGSPDDRHLRPLAADGRRDGRRRADGRRERGHSRRRPAAGRARQGGLRRSWSEPPQSIGFRTDVKLNRMAEEIRRSMMLGLKGDGAQ